MRTTAVHALRTATKRVAQFITIPPGEGQDESNDPSAWPRHPWQSGWYFTGSDSSTMVKRVSDGWLIGGAGGGHVLDGDQPTDWVLTPARIATDDDIIVNVEGLDPSRITSAWRHESTYSDRDGDHPTPRLHGRIARALRSQQGW